MDNSLKICIDKVIKGREPPQYVLSSEARETLRSIAPVERAAIITAKMWPEAKKLRISFLEGKATVKDRVKQKAMDWTSYSNVGLEFVSDSNADIRVAFQQGAGSWSSIGTDALSVTNNEPYHELWMFRRKHRRQGIFSSSRI